MLGKRGVGKRGVGKRGVGKRGVGKRGVGKRGVRQVSLGAVEAWGRKTLMPSWTERWRIRWR